MEDSGNTASGLVTEQTLGFLGIHMNPSGLNKSKANFYISPNRGRG